MAKKAFGGKDDDAAKQAVREVDEKAKTDGSKGGASKVGRIHDLRFSWRAG